MGRLNTEIQLSEDQKYYHGYHKEYNTRGILVRDGQWNIGRRTGSWKYYEPNMAVIEEIVYKDNKPMLTKYMEEGQWTQYRWEDYSEEEKEFYLEDANEQYGPANNPEYFD